MTSEESSRQHGQQATAEHLNKQEQHDSASINEQQVKDHETDVDVNLGGLVDGSQSTTMNIDMVDALNASTAEDAELPLVPPIDLPATGPSNQSSMQGMQLLMIAILIWMKYGAQFCGLRMTGSQSKVFGSLLMCQALVLHQRTDYGAIIYDFDMKTLIEAFIIGMLSVLALLHLSRVNHFIPDSWKGESQVIAERVMSRNSVELQLRQQDIVYENKCQLTVENDVYYEEEDQVTYLDQFVCLIDFLVQALVALILLGHILTREGFSDVLEPGNQLHVFLRNLGLNNSLNLIALFTLCHVNQSRYSGINSLDKVQYSVIRGLAVALPFMVVLRADFNGTLKYHFEQLLIAVLWTAYLLIVDWSKSQESSLGDEIEAAYERQDRYKKKVQLENSPERRVYIMFRKDGRGGIQGIVLDSYFIDRDGRISNEFYVVLDNDEGEIKRLDESAGIKQLENVHEIEKVFFDYFLKKRPEIAATGQL